MKILLVYPETPDTFWNFRHALRFISKKASLPPLGLLTVAAMLPKDWKKKLVDMTVEALTDKDITWADYVFISAMFIQKKSVLEIISRCKKLKTKIVAGGPLFTTVPQYFEDVDHLVLGEAEITLPYFLKDLKTGQAKHIYKSEKRADMEKTPVPLAKLVNMKKYASMCIQYSRGCPFSCDFCDITSLFGHKIRTKTKEQIIAELNCLYNYGWRDTVFFVDDNFIGNKTKLKKQILPAMIEWMQKKKHPFSLNTQASINLADDDELMQLMANAGFETVFVGIESQNENCLAECGKTQNKNRDMVSCVKKMQQFGLQVQAGFILGFDSDQPSVFEKTISFIQASGIVTAMVGLLNAPQNTELYKRLAKQNRLLKDSTGNNTDFSMNFVPKMNYDELIAGYKKVVGTIYSYNCYYERIKTFLKNYNPSKNTKFKIRFRDIRTLIKSTWLLGIKEKGRIYYWRLFFWTLFRKPQLMELSITFAIYGFHFRKIFGTC